MSTLICESSHLCFASEPEPPHKTSHLCFGKRYRPTLLPIEVAAVVSVLNEAVHQMVIIGKTLPVDKNSKWREDFRTISERFGKPPQSPRINPELAGMWPSATEAMLKVQRDRLFVETVLDSTLTELQSKGSFATLRTSLDWQCAMQADERDLFSRLHSATESVRALAQQISDEKQNMAAQALFWRKKHELLTSNLHDAHLVAGLTTEYARRWEQTRRDQHGLILGREEALLRDRIDDLQDPDAPNEERAHSEVVRFLVKDTQVLKKELDHWTDLYDAEMMQRETDLIRMRSNREQQVEQHRELMLEMKHRQATIEETAVLRAKNEEKQRLLANIVAIQSWWRGVSFRAGFTKDIKSKGKKSKKGKKDKKKKRLL